MYRELYPERTKQLEELASIMGESIDSIPDICWLLQPQEPNQNDIEWAIKEISKR